jgi:hypothetical protein
LYCMQDFELLIPKFICTAIFPSWFGFFKHVILYSLASAYLDSRSVVLDYLLRR